MKTILLIAGLFIVAALSGCSDAQLTQAQAGVTNAQHQLDTIHAATTQASAELITLKQQAATQPALASVVATEQRAVDTSLQAEVIATKALATAQATLNTIQTGQADPALVAALGAIPAPWGPLAAVGFSLGVPLAYSIFRSGRTVSSLIQTSDKLAANVATSVPGDIHIAAVAAATTAPVAK